MAGAKTVLRYATFNMLPGPSQTAANSPTGLLYQLELSAACLAGPNWRLQIGRMRRLMPPCLNTHLRWAMLYEHLFQGTIIPHGTNSLCLPEHLASETAIHDRQPIFIWSPPTLIFGSKLFVLQTDQGTDILKEYCIQPLQQVVGLLQSKSC